MLALLPGTTFCPSKTEKESIKYRAIFRKEQEGWRGIAYARARKVNIGRVVGTSIGIKGAVPLHWTGVL
jgi:hypothetical protein